MSDFANDTQKQIDESELRYQEAKAYIESNEFKAFPKPMQNAYLMLFKGYEAEHNKNLELQQRLDLAEDILVNANDKLNKMEKDVNTLTGAVNSIVEEKTVEQLMSDVERTVASRFGAEQCDMYALAYDKDNQENTTLVFSVDKDFKRHEVRLNENNLIAKAITEGEPIIINDDKDKAKYNIGKRQEDRSVKNMMIVPTRDKENNVTSVIVVRNKADRQPFTKSDLQEFNEGEVLGNSVTAILNTKLAQERNDALEYARTHDMVLLDSMLNREGEKKFLENEVVAAMNSENRAVFTMEFDIDHFKFFNDEHSHQIGDECLKHVERVINKTIEELKEKYPEIVDLVPVRRGGEELSAPVILDTADFVSHKDIEQRAVDIANEFRIAIENSRLTLDEEGKPIMENGKPIDLAVQVSIGVAEFEKHPDVEITKENVSAEYNEKYFAKADEALYISKGYGRNQVTASPSFMATKMFEEYLNTQELTLKEDIGGFALYDGDALIKDSIQNAQEVIDTLESKEVLRGELSMANGLITVIRDNFEEYKQTHNLEHEFDTSTEDPVKWFELIESFYTVPDEVKAITDKDEKKEAMKPVRELHSKYEAFMTENKSDCLTLRALVSQTNEINLSDISEKTTELIKAEKEAEKENVGNKEASDRSSSPKKPKTKRQDDDFGNR